MMSRASEHGWPQSGSLGDFARRWGVRMIVALIVIVPGHRMMARAAPQQGDVMTNETIVELVQAKTGEKLIIDLIKRSRTQFDVSLQAILRLKKAGVSDAIIEAMMAKRQGEPIEATSTTDGSKESPPGASSGLPTEIGVYVRRGDQWTEVLPEVINWKTGGVLKSIVTAGIVKRDINGRLRGRHSQTKITLPVEFLILAPEGVAITEYQLVKLHVKKKAREFRTVTGGVIHASGGAQRNLVPFKWEKIAARTYRVVFEALPPGEYGFLPPGQYTSASASAQLGKMYTFRVAELQ